MESDRGKFHLILRERARHLSQPVRKKIEKTARFIVFSLGNEYYGFEVKYAREAVKAERTKFVPCAPNFVEGVINLRGNIISVINLAKILNIEDLTHIGERWVIVVEVGQVEAALHVDAVKGVFDVSESSIEPLLVTLTQRPRKHDEGEAVEKGKEVEESDRGSRMYLTGEVHIEDHLVGILNLEKILVAEEIGRTR